MIATGTLTVDVLNDERYLAESQRRPQKVRRAWRRLLPRAALFFAAAVFGVLSAFGQGGPPMQTDDPGTPGNNNWEVNVAHTADRAQAVHEYSVPILDLNYGLGPRLQLNYQVPYLLQSVNGSPLESGLGKSSAAVKWRFWQNDEHRFNLSTYPRIEFNNPTDSVRRGLADPGTRFLLPFEVTKSLGPLDLNVESGVWFSGKGIDGHIFGFAAGHQTKHSLELLSEVYRITGNGGNDVANSYGLGGRYEFHKGMLFIFEVARGFGGPPDQRSRFLGYFGLQFQIRNSATKD